MSATNWGWINAVAGEGPAPRGKRNRGYDRRLGSFWRGGSPGLCRHIIANGQRVTQDTVPVLTDTVSSEVPTLTKTVRKARGIAWSERHGEMRPYY